MKYLRKNNPRLLELKRRYTQFDKVPFKHTQWNEQYVESEVEIANFRADNAYIWQTRDANTTEAYELTFQYLKSIDTFDLFARLGEDKLFGVETSVCQGVLVSRDLLDSINEIYFLHRTLNILSKKDVNILDIGSGYGRFAHRAAQAIPYLKKIECVDAIAMSTFLIEFYTAYRNVQNFVAISPFDSFFKFGLKTKPTLATSTHCFSEISLEAVDWWVDFLAKNKVAYLFICPNAVDNGGTKLLAREHLKQTDFSKILVKYGYKLVHSEPKYLEPIVQEHGVSPTHYYLFKLH